MKSICIIFQQNQIIYQNVEAEDQFLGLLQEKIFNHDATEGSSLQKQIVQSCDLLVNLRDKTDITDQQVVPIAKSLGIYYEFFQQNYQIQLFGIQQSNIFCKKSNSGLEIFFILLAGFKANDGILQGIRKNLSNSIKYVIIFANQYYENNKKLYSNDLQKWSYFKELLNSFSQEEQQWILKNFTFILLDILSHWEKLDLSEKKQPNKLNQQISVSSQEEFQGASTKSSDSFLQSNQCLDASAQLLDQDKIPIEQYALINLDKATIDKIDICSVQSYKLNDNKEQGISIYLYMQITQMIFKKFQKKFQEQMIRENRQTTNISFLLMPNRSGSQINHLSEFLRDSFNDVIKSEAEQKNLNQVDFQFNEESFNTFATQELTKARVRNFFKTDERYQYFTYQGKQYELNDFVTDNRVIIPHQLQKEIILANLIKHPLISNNQNASQEEILINTQLQQDIIRSINSQLTQAIENGQNQISIPDELQNQIFQQSSSNYYTLIPNNQILSAVEYINSFIQKIKTYKMEDSSALWKDPQYLEHGHNIERGDIKQ